MGATKAFMGKQHRAAGRLVRVLSEEVRRILFVSFSF